MKSKVTMLLLLLSILTSCVNKKKEYATYEEYPIYKGNDLELTYTPKRSTFKVWSPAVDAVKLLLFRDGYKEAAYRMIDLEYTSKGVWKVEVEEDLKGQFYTFQVRVGEKWLNETPGMWAKAVGVNGQRAAIIDMEQTHPTGWEEDKRPPFVQPTDAVIYEVHIRDFSISPNSGMKNKGKFLSFTEEGTKNSFGQSTGLDHLKELGITHVHLLPSFDYASIDETKLNENRYNWGYDPQNYNVPEGSYATDPYDPTVRIKEFKQMVQKLHQSGIRVVMDVVYNHTYVGGESHLNQLVPGYFYRFRPDSTWSNASGCGNETASERPMMRQFIVESVAYWAEEYHIDGFRFDLMGIHDIETMNAVRKRLDKIDPSILLYGEGWTADSTPLPAEKQALKKNVSQLDGIAVFSDDIRDVLKGNWTNDLPGFVAGGDSLENALKFAIVGAIPFEGIDTTRLVHTTQHYATHPTQVINYVSCHDDMCLVDKLKSRLPKWVSEHEVLSYNKLAQTVVFTSQGIPFIYAGEELYRDKKGVNNTYKSPDSINQIDWDNKQTHREIYDYYKALIALRKAHPAFRMTDGEMVRQHLKFVETGVPNVVAYQLTDNANGDAWQDILLLFNGNRYDVSVAIPQNSWNVVAHRGVLQPTKPLFRTTSSHIVIGASSATIMYSQKES